MSIKQTESTYHKRPQIHQQGLIPRNEKKAVLDLEPAGHRVLHKEVVADDMSINVIAKVDWTLTIGNGLHSGTK